MANQHYALLIVGGGAAGVSTANTMRRKNSDIDIAILGANIDFETTSRLHGKLNEELPIPYFIDVVNYNTINVDELKQHILTEGVVIYQKME